MRLVFVGDVMLGRLINDVLAEAPPRYPWGDTLPLFESANLRVCNLECAIADAGTPWSRTPKMFHFRSDARNVATLNAAGIDFVSLANNHALDYGYEALYEMLGILQREGIAHAGAGRSIEAAAQPALLTREHVRIGCVAFTDNEPAWEAGPGKAGVHYTPIDTTDPRAKRLFDIVYQTREQTDLMIVSAHWGPNWGHRPRAEHIPFAHALIDHGADIVFGHSCHVFQGIEIYKKRPILYSCGDFVDDYRVSQKERNDQSFVFAMHVAGREITSLELRPTVIRSFQARLAQNDEAETITRQMQALCAEMGTESAWDPQERVLRIPVTTPHPV